MKWIGRIFLGLAGLLLLAVGVLVIGTLMTLDWNRTHSKVTAALPVYEENTSDSLVRIEANGLEFRARIFGTDNDGPGIIMLHGFPETSIMWEPLAQKAASEGYRVVAFDQRGYSPGARPKEIPAYQTTNMVSDVIAIADVVGFDQFHLVGHDWGCVVAWTTAIQQAERLLSLSVLSIPHPNTLLANFNEDPPLYFQIFTMPGVPEIALLFNDKAGLRWFYSATREEFEGSAHSEGELEEYFSVLTEPGALTSALHWYRATASSTSALEGFNPEISIPTLFIYGSEERWVTPEALEKQQKLMTGSYQTLEVNAGHWVMQEQPTQVVAAILDHLSAADGR